MAIGTGDLINKFGTTDRVDDLSTQAVSDGAFSNDPVAWPNTDDTPLVVFDFKGQYPSGTLVASPFIAIYARALNINGTDDANVPSSTNPHDYLGNINLDGGLAAVTNIVKQSDAFALPAKQSGQQWEFYFENNTGVTISAGWELSATPYTLGPKA